MGESWVVDDNPGSIGGGKLCASSSTNQRTHSPLMRTSPGFHQNTALNRKFTRAWSILGTITPMSHSPTVARVPQKPHLVPRLLNTNERTRRA